MMKNVYWIDGRKPGFMCGSLVAQHFSSISAQVLTTWTEEFDSVWGT